MATPTETVGIIAATSLGPLTTTFSPPSSCLPPSPYSDIAYGIEIYKVGTVSADDGCLPSNWVVNGYYSPGVCPQSYTAVCELSGNNVATTVCCPYYDLYFFQCWPLVKYGSYGCGFYTTFEGTRLTTIFAPSIQIINAASDADGLTGSPSSQESTTTASVTSSGVIPTDSTNTINSNLVASNTADPGISAVDTSTQNDSDSSNSDVRVLGNGAVAGIVVGVIGAVILGAAGTFFYMRRRLASSPPPSSPSPPPLPPRNPELAIHELHDKSRPPEMPESNTLYELHQPHSQSEMPTWSEDNPQGPNKPMAWELPA
ncbi:hypothetical protein F4813DRAFT_272728 [Daldinia decipiens]|uniref:uncharacterized protein n=1 Tax=Daldinia decipiens TaxID=326647 RepID=UPI0020C26771|nr:uncharacterized protein F4813DRAFT_272728 [Daldinia decipiens]KAI1661030.1 hypothetical protein F4813DRAFT_272728 [Daldinia decipiens]